MNPDALATRTDHVRPSEAHRIPKHLMLEENFCWNTNRKWFLKTKLAQEAKNSPFWIAFVFILGEGGKYCWVTWRCGSFKESHQGQEHKALPSLHLGGLPSGDWFFGHWRHAQISNDVFKSNQRYKWDDYNLSTKLMVNFLFQLIPRYPLFFSALVILPISQTWRETVHLHYWSVDMYCLH